MITSEKLEATKVTLNDKEGKATIFVYGQTAKDIITILERQLNNGGTAPLGASDGPKRRGRKPKAKAEPEEGGSSTLGDDE